MGFVAGEMQDRVAEDDVGALAGKRHLIDGAGLEVFCRQAGIERLRELADVADSGGISVEGEDFASLAKKVDEIATVAATGVEDAHGGGDVAAQELIEDVDVDLAELLLQVEWNEAAPES